MGSSGKRVTMNELPGELLQHIMGFLPTNEGMLACRGVSRSFQQAVGVILKSYRRFVALSETKVKPILDGEEDSAPAHWPLGIKLQSKEEGEGCKYDLTRFFDNGFATRIMSLTIGISLVELEKLYVVLNCMPNIRLLCVICCGSNAVELTIPKSEEDGRELKLRYLKRFTVESREDSNLVAPLLGMILGKVGSQLTYLHLSFSNPFKHDKVDFSNCVRMIFEAKIPIIGLNTVCYNNSPGTAWKLLSGHNNSFIKGLTLQVEIGSDEARETLKEVLGKCTGLETLKVEFTPPERVPIIFYQINPTIQAPLTFPKMVNLRSLTLLGHYRHAAIVPITPVDVPFLNSLELASMFSDIRNVFGGPETTETFDMVTSLAVRSFHQRTSVNDLFPNVRKLAVGAHDAEVVKNVRKELNQLTEVRYTKYV